MTITLDDLDAFADRMGDRSEVTLRVGDIEYESVEEFRKEMRRPSIGGMTLHVADKTSRAFMDIDITPYAVDIFGTPGSEAAIPSEFFRAKARRIGRSRILLRSAAHDPGFWERNRETLLVEGLKLLAAGVVGYIIGRLS